MRQQKPSHYTRNSYTVLGLYPMLILSDETIPCCDCDPKKWGHHGHHGHFPMKNGDLPRKCWMFHDVPVRFLLTRPGKH